MRSIANTTANLPEIPRETKKKKKEQSAATTENKKTKIDLEIGLFSPHKKKGKKEVFILTFFAVNSWSLETR